MEAAWTGNILFFKSVNNLFHLLDLDFFFLSFFATRNICFSHEKSTNVIACHMYGHRKGNTACTTIVWAAVGSQLCCTSILIPLESNHRVLLHVQICQGTLILHHMENGEHSVRGILNNTYLDPEKTDHILADFWIPWCSLSPLWKQ